MFTSLMNSKVYIYDTTLRDGSQAEGINFSLSDKLFIAEKLSAFGIHYIECGWPGSNEKDMEFFKAARKRNWGQAKICAFGSTRRPNAQVENDPQVKMLLDAETPVVTCVGKSWLMHVTEVLRTTPDENRKMIFDTIAYLKKNGREAVYDAEHFFDGYKDNPEHALASIQAAADAGADYVVLCDTNGGTLPYEVSEITRQVVSKVKCAIGIHTHEDCGMAVANAIAALQAGATQVQGTINGYGERTGNCNLTSIMPILELKLKSPVLPQGKLMSLSELSRTIDEVANQVPNMRAPFVGACSFAHKGGIHVNAINKNASSYEHINPAEVGNAQRILVGELSGRTNVTMKARQLGVELDEKAPETKDILEEIKRLENYGYEFEAADASFELLVSKKMKPFTPFFSLEEYHVSVRKNLKHDFGTCEATVKMYMDNERTATVADGEGGPVNALNSALRKALHQKFPEIDKINLVDYKVRIINSAGGTAAKIRVLILSTDGNREWSTVGVSENIIEASWLALVDSVEYFLMRSRNV